MSRKIVLFGKFVLEGYILVILKVPWRWRLVFLDWGQKKASERAVLALGSRHLRYMNSCRIGW